MTTPTGTFIDIGHTKVAYECIGSGPDVLFVHGWPLHRKTWREVVGGLAGYRCHLIDLPGAGESRATADTPLTLRGQAESVARVIDALDLDQVHLVGNDSGGMFARMAAAQRPDSVASLVVTGSEIPGHHPWLVTMYKLLAKTPGGHLALKATMASKTLSKSPLALGACFADTSRISPRFVAMLQDSFTDPAVTKSQLELVRNFDTSVVDALRDVHAQLTMPTLLIWGERDPFFPVEKARAMLQQFAGPSSFEVIPDAKLLVHEEHPEHFVELVRSFLPQ